jgi:NitT/TauT family transport system substrate-binding protein
MLAGLIGIGSARSEPIIIGHTSSLIYMPSYVAVSKGYFKDEGLDAEIRIFRGGAQALAAVISGDAHIYVGVPSTAMQAVAKGQAVKVYAAVMNQLSMDVILQGDVAKSKGITPVSTQEARIQALKGLSLGVNASGGSPDQVLRFMLKKAGIDAEKDVTISPVGDNAATLAVFSRKRIDGFLLSPPTSDIAVSKFGGTKIFSFSKGEYEPLSGILYLGLISRADWLAANPDRSARIVRAIWRAEKLIQENPAEATEATRTFFSALDKEAFEGGAVAVMEAIPNNPRIEARSMEISKSFNEIVSGEKFDVDLSAVYTNEYVDLAAKKMQ